MESAYPCHLHRIGRSPNYYKKFDQITTSKVLSEKSTALNCQAYITTSSLPLLHVSLMIKNNCNDL